MSDPRTTDPAAGPASPRLSRALARLMGEPAAAAPDGSATGPGGAEPAKPDGRPGEHGGPKGPEPTRYGDWERKGRCIDF